MADHISLRPANRDDIGFLSGCFLRSMRSAITAARGQWNRERETEQFLRQLVIDRTEIIESAEQRFGFMMLDAEGDAIVIHTVCLLPEHQGRGIGSILIGMLCERYAGRIMQLSVLKVNTRAISFWQRHGFATVGESEHHFRMRRSRTGDAVGG